MTPQEMLRQNIQEAWNEFAEIAKEEEEGDFGDAMLSMDRTHAEGRAEGLSYAYFLIFDEEYRPEIEVDN